MFFSLRLPYVLLYVFALITGLLVIGLPDKQRQKVPLKNILFWIGAVLMAASFLLGTKGLLYIVVGYLICMVAMYVGVKMDLKYNKKPSIVGGADVIVLPLFVSIDPLISFISILVTMFLFCISSSKSKIHPALYEYMTTASWITAIVILVGMV